MKNTLVKKKNKLSFFQKAIRKIKKLFFTATEGNLYFVLVGIDKYKKMQDLDFCVKDSEHLLNLWNIETNYNIKNKNVYKLYNSDATKFNIISVLEKLSASTNFNDKIVMHFSGHEFQKHNVNFFIPSDGFEDNMYSCMSSININNYVKDLKCSILLIDNMINDYSEYSNPNFEKRLLYSSYRKFMDLNLVNDSLFENLISFLKVSERNRRKEVFLISKGNRRKINRNYKDYTELTTNDKELKFVIKSQEETILKLLNEDKIEPALENISNIVSNNDTRLKSQVDTLRYKNYKSLSEDNNEQNSIIKKESSLIKELSKGIVQEIHKDGFYLVNMPNPKGSKRKQKEKRQVVLFTSANPINCNNLRLDNEYRDIEFELMSSKLREKFDLIPCVATRISDFQKKLLNLKPQYIHFSGHGACEGICLLNNDDNADIVENEALSNLFKLFSKYIECVFLNSCHSINQSKPISKHVPNVVCMENSVNDETAILFARSFYTSIFAGEDIAFSFEYAKNSIELHKLSDSEIPKLLTSSN
jgi:hypothetical protein